MTSALGLSTAGWSDSNRAQEGKGWAEAVEAVDETHRWNGYGGVVGQAHRLWKRWYGRIESDLGATRAQIRNHLLILVLGLVSVLSSACSSQCDHSRESREDGQNWREGTEMGRLESAFRVLDRVVTIMEGIHNADSAREGLPELELLSAGLTDLQDRRRGIVMSASKSETVDAFLAARLAATYDRAMIRHRRIGELFKALTPKAQAVIEPLLDDVTFTFDATVFGAPTLGYRSFR